MSIKAKLEAIIYAAEDPITLDQMAALLKDDLLALKTALPATLKLHQRALLNHNPIRTRQKIIWARWKNPRRSHPQRKPKKNLRRLSCAGC